MKLLFAAAAQAAKQGFIPFRTARAAVLRVLTEQAAGDAPPRPLAMEAKLAAVATLETLQEKAQAAAKGQAQAWEPRKK